MFGARIQKLSRGACGFAGGRSFSLALLLAGVFHGFLYPAMGQQPTAPPESPSADARAGTAEAFPEEQAAMSAVREHPGAENRARLAGLRYVRAFQTANFALEQGDWAAFELAVSYAESATELDPGRADYWFLYGRLLTEQAGNPRAVLLAEHALKQAVSLNPELGSARLLLGQLFFDQARFDPALDQYEEAVRGDAALRLPPIFSAMCLAYLVDYQWERGIRFFRQLLIQQPSADGARLAVAVLLHEQKKLPEARAELDKVIQRKGVEKIARQYALSLRQQWAAKEAR